MWAVKGGNKNKKGQGRRPEARPVWSRELGLNWDCNLSGISTQKRSYQQGRNEEESPQAYRTHIVGGKDIWRDLSGEITCL